MLKAMLRDTSIVRACQSGRNKIIGVMHNTSKRPQPTNVPAALPLPSLSNSTTLTQHVLLRACLLHPLTTAQAVVMMQVHQAPS